MSDRNEPVLWVDLRLNDEAMRRLMRVLGPEDLNRFVDDTRALTEKFSEDLLKIQSAYLDKVREAVGADVVRLFSKTEP